MDVTERAPLRVLVVLVVVEHTQRILTLRIGSEGLGKLAVLCIDGEVGVELKCVFEYSAGGIDTLCAVHREVLADDYLAVEQLVVGIGTCRKAVELRVLDGSHVAVVACREECRAFLAAIAHREVVLLHHSRAGDFLEPVGVAEANGGSFVEKHIHSHAVEHGDAGLVVAPVEVIAQRVVVGIEAVVDRCLPESASPLAGIHGFDLVGVERSSHAGIEVHLHLALLAFLGGDDDDAVGCARTIDRCRGCILEHLDRLDVVAVELVHTCLCGHSVDDVERVVVVQRSDTADAHRGCTARITVGRDVHTRHSALQGFHGVVLVLLLHLADTHRRHGSRQVGLALCGVACHHHLAKLLRIVLQGDFQTVGSGYFL